MTQLTATVSANPFTAESRELALDDSLALRAAQGEEAALTELLRRHQQWVNALALRMMLNPQDAHDVAQEALLRIASRIGQFEGRSSFRTWAYRVVFNCFLDAKRGRLEGVVSTFKEYGDALDGIRDLPLRELPEPEHALLVEEAKVGCMLGMLLCLTREQRLAFILGEIFECPSQVGAEILQLAPAAFRKRLERARSDLTAFMNEKCGLMNDANPCRCDKKTEGFIAAGWVDAERLKFTAAHVRKVREHVRETAKRFDLVEHARVAGLFQEHPLLDGPDLVEKVIRVIHSEEVQRAFDLEKIA